MTEECENFLSSSDRDRIRACHEGQGHDEINPPGLPPGSVSKLVYANAIGAEMFVREYGFDAAESVVVIIETRGRKIDREAFLAACRNTSQWYWQLRIDTGNDGIQKQWHPVPTIPDNSLTRNPKYHQNAKTEDDSNAFCVSYRNGNRLVGYDQSWTADPGDARALAAIAAVRGGAAKAEDGDGVDEMEAYLDQLTAWAEARERDAK